jgi:hypothetical protein
MFLKSKQRAAFQLDSLIAQHINALGLAQQALDVGDHLDAQILDACAHETGDRQARYLAEEIYLAHYQTLGQVERGIIAYIRAFVRQRYPGDEARERVAEQICAEIRARREPEARAVDELRALLAQRPGLPPLPGVPHNSLRELYAQVDLNGAAQWQDVVFLPPQAAIYVIGDSHGDTRSTQSVLDEIQHMTGFDSAPNKPYIVFLGDYVHNGLDSIGNLVEILRFQKQHPQHVILLSGNHDSRESWHTALNEYFEVHWTNAIQNPFAGKLPPDHYGHARLDLARKFGAVAGEQLYRDFEDWGLSLPYICFDAHGLMMSHSVGKLAGPIQLADLVGAKQDELASVQGLGYASWKREAESLHAALVNNRAINGALLDEFGALGVSHFVVGHSHYRSGDIMLHGGKMLITVCPSHPLSPDAGHYMYQEMEIHRNKHRARQGLPQGAAGACYVSFTQGQERKIKVHPIGQVTKGDIP